MVPRRKITARSWLSLRAIRRARSMMPTLALVLSLFLTQESNGQNLINRTGGRIANTGTIRVKDQALGLPDTLGGTFELFGANQLVPGKIYGNLNLIGSGTKTAEASLTVLGIMTIAPAVTLQVPSTYTAFLGNTAGRLAENGYLSGKVQKTVTLSGATTQSDFGGIGVSVQWSGTAPGITTIARTSGTTINVGGKTSIQRYFDIQPTVDSTLNATLTFTYALAEASGANLSTLELWRSPDGGTTWRRQRSTHDPVLKTLTRTGLESLGRWTAADGSNALGIAKYEWEADSLKRIAGNGQIAAARSLINPFVVKVTDAFNQPVRGANVQFVVTGKPVNSVGDSLTVLTATTDQFGLASTRLKLGNARGTYIVAAQTAVLPNDTALFSADAQSIAVALPPIAGNNQVDSIKTTVAPFKVRVKAADSSAVPGVEVRFAIASTPPGATGYQLSDTVRFSDAAGDAQTVLRLGTKVGRYVIKAYSPDIPGDTTTFAVDATHGFVAQLTSTPDPADTILNVVSPLAVTLTDDELNPVPGEPIQFTVVTKPVGATGDSLITTTATTDTAGRASTTFKLGNKVGTYRIEALATNLPTFSHVFNANALAGRAAALAAARGDSQKKSVVNLLDSAFVVRVSDVGGNAVQGVPVQFTVSSKPAGAGLDSLTRFVDTTNALGEASTVLRLGTKVGTYAVTATSSRVSGVTRTFSADAFAGLAATADTTAGNSQLAFIGSRLNPFVVTVRDKWSNLVPGLTVTFSTATVPNGATRYGLSKITDVTDSLGRASTVLTLGNKRGKYNVVASVQDLASVIFASDAFFNFGDPNNTGQVDVADLTMLIDHILGKITLTGYDFVKADMNGDGQIDVRDVVILRDKLLTDNWGVADSIANIAGGLNPSLVSSGAAMTADSSLSRAPLLTAFGQLEITKLGLRFNLFNDQPAKGIQVILKLKTPVKVSKADVIFGRAKMMTVEARSSNDTVRVVAYNFSNMPIDTGSGSVFRLSIKLVDSTDILSSRIIVSTGNNIATGVPSGTMENTTLPITYNLYQNYPNPFNPSTTIEYEVPEIEGKVPRVAIQIFNILGEKVKTIDRGDKDAGRYKVIWDGTNDQGIRASTGVYFYRLISADYVMSKKMILLK